MSMSTSPDPLPTLASWLPIQFQLVAFPEDAEAAMNQNWFAELIGGECERTTKKHLRTESGKIHGHGIRLEIDALRIKWLAFPAVDPLEFQGGPPNLGSYTEAIAWFSDLGTRWLTEMCPPITRLGFSSKVMQPTESRDASYHMLGRYLHDVRVDPVGVNDLQFRINRKRPSSVGIEGLKVNRLATWTAVKFEAKIVATGGGTTREILHEQYGCMLELDVNTEHEFGRQLPAERIPNLWRELVQFGSEITQDGDVP